MTRDFGNSIVRCAMSKRLFKLFSIYIYISNEIFFSFFIFTKTFLSLETRLFRLVKHGSMYNFKRLENRRGSTSTGGSTTTLSASILFSSYRSIDVRRISFRSDRKNDPSIRTALDNRITEKWKKKEGRSDDGEVKKKWRGEKNRGEVRERREEEILWMPQKLRISVSRRIEK